MVELQRITTEYIDTEDRLRLSGEVGAQATVVVVWLTQRLLNLLIPPLCKWLERQSDVMTGAGNPTIGLPTDVVQSFAQQAAVAALEQQAPVRAPVHASMFQSGGLVDGVQLLLGDHGVVLRFQLQAQGGDGIQLTLQTQLLRQWLNIVHDQYRQAGWPLDIWPVWLTGASGSSGLARALIL